VEETGQGLILVLIAQTIERARPKRACSLFSTSIQVENPHDESVAGYGWLVLATLGASGCTTAKPERERMFENYSLNFDTPVDAALQTSWNPLTRNLRGQFGMTAEQTAAGLLDLQTSRLAMIHRTVRNTRRACRKSESCSRIFNYILGQPRTWPRGAARTRTDGQGVQQREPRSSRANWG